MRRGEAALFGLVQGLTEFLPVSSSAHLALLRTVMHRRRAPRAFDVALHLATTAALLIATHADVVPPTRSLLSDLARQRTHRSGYRPGSLLAVRLGLATLPAVAAGALLHRRLEQRVGSPDLIGVSLLAGALGMPVAERSGRHYDREPAAISTAETLAIGLVQAAALVPGVSRSGATITAGMALGLGREGAARYSFLLAVPVTLAAAVRTAPEMRGMLHEVGREALAIGAATSSGAGLVGIALLRRLVHRRGLMPFVWYRCVLAAALWAADTRRR